MYYGFPAFLKRFSNRCNNKKSLALLFTSILNLTDLSGMSWKSMSTFSPKRSCTESTRNCLDHDLVAFLQERMIQVFPARMLYIFFTCFPLIGGCLQQSHQCCCCCCWLQHLWWSKLHWLFYFPHCFQLLFCCLGLRP